MDQLSSTDLYLGRLYRSYICLKIELVLANCKRSVDKNHYFITDCMNIEFVSPVIFLRIAINSENNRI